MSLNLDDPLAGILSDGSDDSFFDDDILGKKKPAKKKSTPISEKKSSLFDFGDVDKTKSSGNMSDSKRDALFDLGGDKIITEEFKTSKPTASPAPIKRSISKESLKIPLVDAKTKDVLKSPAKPKVSSSSDKLDILGELGSNKKDLSKNLEKGKSSQSILDDILGGSSIKTGGSSQFGRPVTAAKSQDFDFDSFLGKSDSKQTKNLPQKQIPKVDTLKEDKRPKQENPTKKKSSDDWLGIFQEQDETTHNDDETEMPPWLAGAESKKKKDDKKLKQEIPKEVPIVEKEIEKVKPDQKEKDVPVPQVDLLPRVEQLIPKVATSSVLQGSTEDITAEGAALYLRQQESQLMVAMQLKAQEDKLVAMQMRQKESQRVQHEAALAHHAQLDSMLQRQAEQRNQMQAIISAHQQRISERIKSLLGINAENNDNINQKNEFEPNVTEERESPHTREKKQLLQLVQSLQENHDKEIDLMESSYRRQLAFLEVSLHQGEERMKEESDKLVKFYTEKIHWLEDHHQLYKKMTEENLNSLTERHKAENEMIRQQHLENIRILQEHHAALMENIKNAVKQEQVLIQDSASFSSDLHELVTNVKENKVKFQELVEKVHVLAEHTQKDNDRSLQVRETQINDMIQQLKKERDHFEIEKVECRDMVKMLETRLKQMTTMIEEESAALKQKKMEFEFEKATFSKQTEFAKNILKKQDEEIKSLREDIQKEYDEKITRIEEEKTKVQKDSASIAKEKATIQSLKQDLEKMKAELETQSEELTEERSKLNVEKQQLHMEEQRILAKSRDYDLLAKTAVDKQSQADKKYSEAEFLQRKYEERIRRIQEHVVSLNSREKQIAREKVALSRERLSLHNERKQIDSSQQCSLCKSSQNIPEYNLPSFTLPESFLNVPMTRDYRNVDTAMNNIERDIASLMSRNYSLRCDADVGNSNARETKFQSVETAQVESGTFKDLMDPKFMMLRLDVQKVLSNLDHSKKDDNHGNDDNYEEHSEENQDK